MTQSTKELIKQIDEPKIIYVKKNQIDATAGFLYALGCSLVHFAMLIGIQFVKRPDIGKA